MYRKILQKFRRIETDSHVLPTGAAPLDPTCCRIEDSIRNRLVSTAYLAIHATSFFAKFNTVNNCKIQNRSYLKKIRIQKKNQEYRKLRSESFDTNIIFDLNWIQNTKKNRKMFFFMFHSFINYLAQKIITALFEEAGFCISLTRKSPC